MKTSPCQRCLAVLACAIAAACAAKRPVLYPNAHLQQVGVDASQADIDACMSLAETDVGDASAAASAGGRTAVGAGAGAAIGAAGGAVRGHPGTGAAVGAATAGTAGLLSGLWGARDHDPIFMTYVDTCLHDKGYRSIGWK